MKKERGKSGFAIRMLAWVLSATLFCCGLLPLAENKTYAKEGLTYKEFIERGNVIPTSTLFVGTYLMDATAFNKTDQEKADSEVAEKQAAKAGGDALTAAAAKAGINPLIYKKAKESQITYKQKTAYYRSELSEGQWKNILEATGMDSIMLDAPEVTEEELNPLLITCVVGADGVPVDPVTGEPVNIFDYPSPYEMDEIIELAPLQEFYNGENVTRDSVGSDNYLYWRMYYFFEHDNLPYDRNEVDLNSVQLSSGYLHDDGSNGENLEYIWDAAEVRNEKSTGEDNNIGYDGNEDILMLIRNWPNVRDDITYTDDRGLSAVYSLYLDLSGQGVGVSSNLIRSEEAEQALLISSRLDADRRAEVFYNMLRNKDIMKGAKTSELKDAIFDLQAETQALEKEIEQINDYEIPELEAGRDELGKELAEGAEYLSKLETDSGALEMSSEELEGQGQLLQLYYFRNDYQKRGVRLADELKELEDSSHVPSERYDLIQKIGSLKDILPELTQLHVDLPKLQKGSASYNDTISELTGMMDEAESREEYNRVTTIRNYLDTVKASKAEYENEILIVSEDITESQKVLDQLLAEIDERTRALGEDGADLKTLADSLMSTYESADAAARAGQSQENNPYEEWQSGYDESFSDIYGVYSKIEQEIKDKRNEVDSNTKAVEAINESIDSRVAFLEKRLKDLDDAVSQKQERITRLNEQITLKQQQADNREKELEALTSGTPRELMRIKGEGVISDLRYQRNEEVMNQDQLRRSLGELDVKEMEYNDSIISQRADIERRIADVSGENGAVDSLKKSLEDLAAQRELIMSEHQKRLAELHDEYSANERKAGQDFNSAMAELQAFEINIARQAQERHYLIRLINLEIWEESKTRDNLRERVDVCNEKLKSLDRQYWFDVREEDGRFDAQKAVLDEREADYNARLSQLDEKVREMEAEKAGVDEKEAEYKKLIEDERTSYNKLIELSNRKIAVIDEKIEAENEKIRKLMESSEDELKDFTIGPTLMFLETLATYGESGVGRDYSKMAAYKGDTFVANQELLDNLTLSVANSEAAFVKYRETGFNRGETVCEQKRYSLSKSVIAAEDDVEKALPFLTDMVDLENIEAGESVHPERELAMIDDVLVPLSITRLGEAEEQKNAMSEVDLKRDIEEYQGFIYVRTNIVDVYSAIDYVEQRLSYARDMKKSCRDWAYNLVAAHVTWLENLLRTLREQDGGNSLLDDLMDKKRQYEDELIDSEEEDDINKKRKLETLIETANSEMANKVRDTIGDPDGDIVKTLRALGKLGGKDNAEDILRDDILNKIKNDDLDIGDDLDALAGIGGDVGPVIKALDDKGAGDDLKNRAKEADENSKKNPLYDYGNGKNGTGDDSDGASGANGDKGRGANGANGGASGSGAFDGSDGSDSSGGSNEGDGTGSGDGTGTVPGGDGTGTEGDNTGMEGFNPEFDFGQDGKGSGRRYLDGNDIAEAIRKAYGADYNDLNKAGKASALAGLAQFGKLYDDDSVLAYARTLLDRLFGDSDGFVYQQYLTDTENEYVSFASIDRTRRYSKFRFVEKEAYKTLQQIAGGSASYSFMIGKNTVKTNDGREGEMKFPLNQQTDRYLEPAQVTQFPYLLKEESERYTGISCEYMPETDWAILVPPAYAKQMAALIGELEGMSKSE